MLGGVSRRKRFRQKTERTRSAGPRRAAGSSSSSQRVAASRSTRRVRERRESAAAVPDPDRWVLRSPGDDRIRRADRTRWGYAARPRRAPPLVYAGGVPPGPRGVADPAGSAGRAARDVAPGRPPPPLGGRRGSRPPPLSPPH